MNTICNLSSIRLREEWPHLLFVFLIVFVIYLWSAPQTVVLEDDGYFILAAYFNGTAHPPGYPLYTLLGHLSTDISLVEPTGKDNASCGFNQGNISRCADLERYT